MKELVSKSDQVRALLREGREIDALRIAQTFRHLGDHRDTIRRGWEAYAHPRFARSLKRDPDALVAAALNALRLLYGPSSLS
jgi:hypothetical protein